MKNIAICKSFGITKYEMELYFGYTYDSMLSMVERIHLDESLSEVNADAGITNNVVVQCSTAS